MKTKNKKGINKKKLGAILLILALILSVSALALYLNTEEKAPVEEKALVGGNSANIQLVVEPNGEAVNGQG